MDLRIRQALPADAATIAGFNAAMARETEHLELDPARLRAGVQALLEDSAKGFYILAETGAAIAGQMMITFEWSDWRSGAFWWIQSVYVAPEFRRRGVFGRLYRHIHDRARAQQGVCGLRLYVERENHRAQRTYERIGMRRTSYQFFEVDFVLRREQE